MGSQTPSPAPTPALNPGQDDRLYRLGGHSFIPLQEPELLFSRNHLPGLILQSAGGSAESPMNLFRRPSVPALSNPNLRSMRLIGNSNPRYSWSKYRKTPEELGAMKKPLREYYERNNALIDCYIYVDELLDSKLPSDLLKAYRDDLPPVPEESGTPINQSSGIYGDQYGSTDSLTDVLHSPRPPPPQRRRPSYIYRIADEESPLLGHLGDGGGGGGSGASQARIVKIAIIVNFLANTVLLVAKLLVALLTNSLSVLASLVDGVLDFLSTLIVATTTSLIQRKDSQAYPIGRSRLEPIGVLVFSVIMITSFAQVGITAFKRLFGSHDIVMVGPTAISIMAGTVVIKGACWLWCRLIRNSSVQALAQDALTDVIFNTFSIFFPLLGSFTQQWWLDPLGGLLLSVYVIAAWGRISQNHIRNLTGAAASADERNVLLYLTMRFAESIKQITSVQAYHAGDKLIVEVDVVLDDGLELKDSHDLGESLQNVLESLPIVDRAFVHLDYDSRNPPGHLR